MRCLAGLVLVLFTTVGQAAPVGLQFRNVGIPEFVEAVIKGAMRLDYVLAPSAAALDAKITVSVRSVDPDKLLALVGGVLRGVGVQVQDRDGIIYIEKLEPVAPVSERQNEAAPSVTVSEGQPLPEARQPDKTPVEVVQHRPRGRSLEFLASVARFAGASVPDTKGPGGDVLIYGGSAETVAKVKALLADVDQPAPGYMIRAALLEFSDTSNSSRSFTLALDGLRGKLGVAYAAGAKLANGLTIAGSSIKAALTAIDGDSRFKHVAEPQIRVMDGETAKLTVGSEVPTRGTATLDKNGNPVSSVQYRTAGVVITVSPRQVADGIIVKVGQQISNFSTTTTSNIDSPTVLKREAETTVTAKPGELIMLAGMDETRESRAGSGLAWLPAFFRSTNDEDSRSQMVLLLEVTPMGADAI